MHSEKKKDQNALRKSSEALWGGPNDALEARTENCLGTVSRTVVWMAGTGLQGSWSHTKLLQRIIAKPFLPCSSVQPTVQGSLPIWVPPLLILQLSSPQCHRRLGHHRSHATLPSIRHSHYYADASDASFWRATDPIFGQAKQWVRHCCKPSSKRWQRAPTSWCVLCY